MARVDLVSLLVVATVELTNRERAQSRHVESSPVNVRAAGDIGCAAEIDRFQAIVTSDHETGNVDEKVYQQIEADLTRASAACAAGKNGQAHAIVAASKARHGYRA